MDPKTEKPQKPYHQYSEGQIFAGDKIVQIFSAHEDFLIYRTKGDQCVTFYYDDSNQVYRKNIDLLSHKISLLKSCICSKNEHKRYNYQIAHFYKDCLLGNIESANITVERIIKDVHRFKSNVARLLFLLSCFGVVIIILILSIIQDKFIMNDYFNPYLKIMLFGSMGGFISVSFSLKKLSLDTSFYNWSHSVYGISRILIASMCAIIIYVLIKSGVFLSQYNSEDNMFVYYIFAVIAGFSETFLPNILRNIENKEVQ
ncbi:MAG: hypothetical protein JXB49_16365 [Bacteroidales bacterium]|nr:hypothetical protein [Bacteroidales bacterium]